MTSQSYFTPCSTNHHSSCLQPGRLFCLSCPLRQTGSRHDMRTSLLKKSQRWGIGDVNVFTTERVLLHWIMFLPGVLQEQTYPLDPIGADVVLGQKSWRWPWLFCWHASRLADCSTGTAVWSSKWMEFLDFDGTGCTGTLQRGWTDMSSWTRRY